MRTTPSNALPGKQRHSLLQGAHLIQAGTREVEPGKGGMEAIRHICPAAEEDQGEGIIDQGPQEHFNEGFFLGTEDGWRYCLGSLFRQALKSPSWPSLEPWVPPSPQVLCHAKAWGR